MESILYRSGYKYQLAKDFVISIPVFGVEVVSLYIELTKDGNLLILTGYAWDGLSGGCPDLKCFMRAGLVHDALCQLLREGYLPAKYKSLVHQIFLQVLREDKVWNWVAGLMWRAVSFCGDKYTYPDAIRPLHRAP